MRWYTLFFAFLLLSPPTTTLSASRRAALARGEIFVATIPMPGAYYPKVRVEGVVDAPPTAVWALLTDCAKSERINSRVVKSRVVKRIGPDVVCSEIVDLPWPLPRLEVVARWSFRPGPPVWTRSWTLVDGDFDYANGKWQLEAFGDGTRTLAVYENHFSPQMSVPDWLTKAFIRVGMPGLIKDLRAAVPSP